MKNTDLLAGIKFLVYLNRHVFVMALALCFLDFQKEIQTP